MAKRSKKLLEADRFRARVFQLRNLTDPDWRDWEADWLDKEANRSPDYIYTQKERIILNQLVTSATPLENYNGWTVLELLQIVYGYLADLGDEGEQEFVEQLWKRQPRVLRVRQLDWLASLARLSEPIGRDSLVASILRETRGADDELHYEVPEWVAYPAA